MEVSMAEKPDENELVTFTQMLMATSIQVDAVCQLLIDKGAFTQEEFHVNLAKWSMNTERSKRERWHN
jgi:hypothetical protein